MAFQGVPEDLRGVSGHFRGSQGSLTKLSEIFDDVQLDINLLLTCFKFGHQTQHSQFEPTSDNFSV